MKNPLTIFLLALALGTGLGVWVTQTWISPTGRNTPARLEEVLVVKELHLVRQVYNDIFFLHRKNDQTKAIRAVAQVPVTITAFINLKDMQWVKRNDSIKQIILPKAELNEPSYGIAEMEIKETRGFQFHVGRDLYPQVSTYLSAIIAERQDTIHQRALDNKILTQAEAEGKQYIEGLLKGIGRQDVQVTFGDEAIDRAVAELTKTLTKENPTTPANGNPTASLHSAINNVLYGWIPVD
ncbi:MAG: DUF4230 domain-containing protein [Cyclobacteriaceae bacterium]